MTIYSSIISSGMQFDFYIAPILKQVNYNLVSTNVVYVGLNSKQKQLDYKF